MRKIMDGQKYQELNRNYKKEQNRNFEVKEHNV